MKPNNPKVDIDLFRDLTDSEIAAHINCHDCDTYAGVPMKRYRIMRQKKEEAVNKKLAKVFKRFKIPEPPTSKEEAVKLVEKLEAYLVEVNSKDSFKEESVKVSLTTKWLEGLERAIKLFNVIEDKTETVNQCKKCGVERWLSSMSPDEREKKEAEFKQRKLVKGFQVVKRIKNGPLAVLHDMDIQVREE